MILRSRLEANIKHVVTTSYRSLLPVQLFHDFCHFSDISFVVRGSSSEAGVYEWCLVFDCSWIFVKKGELDVLGSWSTIFIDASYKAEPPNYGRQLTVFVTYDDFSFPVIYVLRHVRQWHYTSRSLKNSNNSFHLCRQRQSLDHCRLSSFQLRTCISVTTIVSTVTSVLSWTDAL